MFNLFNILFQSLPSVFAVNESPINNIGSLLDYELEIPILKTILDEKVKKQIRCRRVY